MAGGYGVHGAFLPEGPSGDAGSAEWRRMYDRVEALLPRVEALAADRARWQEISRTQRDLWEAREKILNAPLLQAEASRTRWKTAYIELPLLANPKITELRENDLKDYRTCEDDDNSELMEARTSVELRQKKEDYEGIAGDLRTELRKLKQAYKTLSSHKDKEMSVLLGIKDFLWNQTRNIDKENMALLKIKEVEAAQATEAAQKLQQHIEELQEEHRNKDDMTAKAVNNAKKRVLILDGKLLEMHSLVKEKNDEIQKLKNEAGEKRRKTASDMHCEQCMFQSMEIFVNISNDKTITVKVNRSDTIYDVKATIKDKEGIPPCQQRLMFEDKLLVGSCTLKDCVIWHNNTLTLHLVLQGMHIFFLTLVGKMKTFEVERADTVYSVKAKIFDEMGLSPAALWLISAEGLLLDEALTLADYNIQNDSTLDSAFFPGGQNDRLCISVRTPTGRTVIEHYALGSETVGCLKQKIHVASLVPPEQQCLYYHGKLLENGYVFTDAYCTYELILEVRLPGGP